MNAAKAIPVEALRSDGVNTWRLIERCCPHECHGCEECPLDASRRHCSVWRVTPHDYDGRIVAVLCDDHARLAWPTEAAAS